MSITGEKIFVYSFITSLLIIPPALTEFFPYSVMPMFSSADKCISEIDFFDQDGVQYDGKYLGLYQSSSATAIDINSCKPPPNEFPKEDILPNDIVNKILIKRLCPLVKEDKVFTIKQTLYCVTPRGGIEKVKAVTANFLTSKSCN
jgi:hypothetical protein